MKRRAFLKYLGVAACAAALPVAIVAGRRSQWDACWDEVLASLKDRQIQPIDGDYYVIMHPDTMKILKGEIGHYEGVRIVEQTRLPNISPNLQHSRASCSPPVDPPGWRAHSAISRRVAFYSKGRTFSHQHKHRGAA